MEEFRGWSRVGIGLDARALHSAGAKKQRELLAQDWFCEGSGMPV
jgi:hypothetical protein